MSESRKPSGSGQPEPTTSFGMSVKRYYGPADLQGRDYDRDLGNPGEYPYTRAIFPGMYRDRLWTMRMYAGYQTSEDTNARFRFLLANGNTGLNMALDLPTQMGLDSDHPEAEDDVGRQGVAVDTLADMERIFDGIPLDRISTAFTINATAPIILAMYIATGEKQGVPAGQLRGTLQNDMLKEYIARGTWIYPPGPSLRLVADVIEYCARHVPRFNPISVSGTHIAECEASSAQILAYTLLNAQCYIDAVRERGLQIDDFAHQITFHYPAGGLETYGWFEIIAKFRAARRMWARLIKEKYGAQNPKSMQFKFSTGAGGRGLTARQPKNNIARLAVYALAAVLGGTRSLNLASYDEAYAIPHEEAARTSLMIQQMLAYELGVTETVDPLGGSYYVESLTNAIEAAALKEMAEVEAQGGILRCIHEGSIQGKLARQAHAYVLDLEEERKFKIGVNKFVLDGEPEQEIELFEVDPETRGRQMSRLAEVKAERDNARVEAALRALHEASRGSANLMPYILDCVRAYATVGEMCGVMKQVFGEYHEPAVF